MDADATPVSSTSLDSGDPHGKPLDWKPPRASYPPSIASLVSPMSNPFVRAQDYDAELAQGLSLSGESKDFFAQGRLQAVGDFLRARGISGTRLLDFGCGIGGTTPTFFDLLQVEEVVGVDGSEDMLEQARSRHGSESASFSLPEHLPAKADFDLAYCNGVFHHILPADRPAALNYIHQRLKPGGWLAFCENNPWNPGTRWVMSRIPFDRDAITLSAREAKANLLATGFELHESAHLFLFPRRLSWLRPIEGWLRSWPLGAQYLLMARKPDNPCESSNRSSET